MSEERYRVDLRPHPDGSSELLSNFIDWGGRAIEASLKLFGERNIEVRDYVKKLEGDGTSIDIDDESDSVTIKNYNEAGQVLAAARESIEVSHQGVDTATFKSSDIAAGTLRSIVGYVNDLKFTLGSAPAPVQDPPTKEVPNPPKRLAASVEAALMSAVAKAVDRTHDTIVEAQVQIAQQAEAIGASAPSYQGNGNPSVGVPASIGTPPGQAPRQNVYRPSSAGLRGYNGNSSNAQPISSGQKARAEEIYRYLRDRYGLTHNEAVAILGNMQVESGLDTGAYNSAEGAIGLIQWEGNRDDALRAFAGNRVGDWKVQVDFMMKEFSTTEATAFERFRSRAAISPADGAAAFDQYYERSAGTSRQARIDNATAFAAAIPNTATKDASVMA